MAKIDRILGTLECNEAIAIAMATIVTAKQLAEILELARRMTKPECLGHEWNNATCTLAARNSFKDNF
jgi:hypothetical protein